jgi:hypothetical protein
MSSILVSPPRKHDTMTSLLGMNQRMPRDASLGSSRSAGPLLAFLVAFVVTMVANGTVACSELRCGKAAAIDHEQDATRTRAVMPWGDCPLCNVVSL